MEPMLNPERAARKRRSLAAHFRPNDGMERLIKLRKTRPDKFDAVMSDP